MHVTIFRLTTFLFWLKGNKNQYLISIKVVYKALKCNSPLPLRVLCSARDLFLIYPEVPFSLRSVDNAHKSK